MAYCPKTERNGADQTGNTTISLNTLAEFTEKKLLHP